MAAKTDLPHLPRPLTPDQREMIQHRIDVLKVFAFGEVDPDAAARELMVILLGFTQTQMTDLQATAKAEKYGDAIEDVPAWAIKRAGKRWAQGNIPERLMAKANFDRPPPPAVLRDLAMLELGAPRAEIRLLDGILKAPALAMPTVDYEARAATVAANRDKIRRLGDKEKGG